MLTIIVNKELVYDKQILINDKGDINHMKNVYRYKIGDKLRVVDGEKEYICELESLDKKEAQAKILEVKEDNYSNKAEIDIAVGILKKDKMDLMIQKLTELGINRIIPMITKRNTVKLKEKKERWDKISQEALKQCRGVKFITIEEPKKVEKLDLSLYSDVIVLYENEENIKLKDLDLKCGPILYIIGSEGGFEEDEISYFKENGAKVASLGKRILRAETAAIVVGGILVNEFN
jgi:16S rRNA (uracil1498-N3)-methyltransferase